LRSISAPTDSPNTPTKLNINKGAASHLFLTHLVGADGRTDDIAISKVFPSLSYFAISGEDADVLLNTQLTG